MARRADTANVDGVRVLVLGPLVVEHDRGEVHVAGSQRRRLLTLLASRHGRPCSVDAIAEALWGDDPPPTTSKSIQNHVARLRRSFSSIDGDVIETTAAGYRLAVDPEAIDAVRFERLAAEGRQRLAAGDAEGAVQALTDALALWRGPPFEELDDTGFAIGETARLDELRAAAIEDLADARLGAGSVELVIGDVERLVHEQTGSRAGVGPADALALRRRPPA